jgi:Na(+)-translocating NADH:ubiquinone oxidoreductase A subunit
MKIKRGYTPKIAGRPSSVVDELPVPEKLILRLQRHGVIYTPVVKDGQKVKFGDTLAETAAVGGKLVLPSPAEGKVTVTGQEGKKPPKLIVETDSRGSVTGTLDRLEPERASVEKVRHTLARGGVWPLFWSSRTNDVPTLEAGERPRAIIVTSVITEPFRTRGKVLLERSWDRIVQGMKYFPRLLTEYGTTEIILTHKRDPVARRLYQELADYAWLHFHPVPLVYPVEDPIVLTRALRKQKPSIKKDDIIWVIDVQGVAAIGACLGEGIPLYQRVAALGGPGNTEPRHVSVRIGTPVKNLLPKSFSSEDTLVLRGGLLKGEPVDPFNDAVEYDDNGFFFLPKMKEREFLSFTRPGFRRTSILPCFMSKLTGAADSEISTSLRGEPRPCIACGLCEMVCPVDLMPQIIHRYLYREDLDKAYALGLDICIDCGLCSYVCTSKIELRQQFMEAMEQIRREQEEAAAAESSTNTSAGDEE